MTKEFLFHGTSFQNLEGIFHSGGLKPGHDWSVPTLSGSTDPFVTKKYGDVILRFQKTEAWNRMINAAGELEYYLETKSFEDILVKADDIKVFWITEKGICDLEGDPVDPRNPEAGNPLWAAWHIDPVTTFGN